MPQESRVKPVSDPRYVGRLAEAWEFPSDHLPVAATFTTLTEEFRCASWNVLNSAFLHYIEQDQQGLNGSAITKDSSVREGTLSKREQTLLEHVRTILASEVGLLALQECGDAFRQALAEELAQEDTHKQLLLNAPEHSSDARAIIFDTRQFELVRTSVTPFASSKKCVFTVDLVSRGGLPLRFVNVHVPGGAKDGPPAREILAKSLKDSPPPAPTILTGDFNFQTSEVETLLHSSDPAWRSANPPYCSHVDTQQRACQIDGVFFRDPNALLATVTPIVEISKLLPAASEVSDLLG